MCSLRSGGASAHASTTWLPWVFTTLMQSPTERRNARPRRAGTITSRRLRHEHLGVDGPARRLPAQGSRHLLGRAALELRLRLDGVEAHVRGEDRARMPA